MIFFIYFSRCENSFYSKVRLIVFSDVGILLFPRAYVCRFWPAPSLQCLQSFGHVQYVPNVLSANQTISPLHCITVFLLCSQVQIFDQTIFESYKSPGQFFHASSAWKIDHFIIGFVCWAVAFYKVKRGPCMALRNLCRLLVGPMIKCCCGIWDPLKLK